MLRTSRLSHLRPHVHPRFSVRRDEKALALLGLGRLQSLYADCVVRQSTLMPSVRWLNTGIVPTLPKEMYFYREQEAQDLRHVLRSRPQFSVILGPGNSGITALTTQVLSEVAQESRVPVAHLDLRLLNFHNVESFYLSLKKHLMLWVERLYRTFPEAMPINFYRCRNSCDFNVEVRKYRGCITSPLLQALQVPSAQFFPRRHAQKEDNL